MAVQTWLQKKKKKRKRKKKIKWGSDREKSLLGNYVMTPVDEKRGGRHLYDKKHHGVMGQISS
jgi:hypothetical protein